MTVLRLALVTVLTAGPVLAQDVARGAEYYFTYCASCHGDDADGGGPMSEILNVVPPDLTALQSQNDGVFPTQRVVFRIDGRDPLLAHGGPMPIYGDIFETMMAPMKAETGQPILAGQGIADLIAYIETLQTD